VRERLAAVGIDPAIALAFGDLKANLRRRGKLIEDLDLLIGATARTLNLTLVTNNLGHFRRIAGIRLERWS
jgi:tRNA(fMet)-specific endonuclease VapC